MVLVGWVKLKLGESITSNCSYLIFQGELRVQENSNIKLHIGQKGLDNGKWLPQHPVPLLPCCVWARKPGSSSLGFSWSDGAALHCQHLLLTFLLLHQTTFKSTLKSYCFKIIVQLPCGQPIQRWLDTINKDMSIVSLHPEDMENWAIKNWHSRIWRADHQWEIIKGKKSCHKTFVIALFDYPSQTHGMARSLERDAIWSMTSHSSLLL